MITLAIADDHALFREGLVSLLEEEKEIQIIGQAANGIEVLELVQNARPDLLLLDIEMPGMDGFDTMRALKEQKISIKILVLTMHKSPQFIKNILKAGASGYLQKDAGKTKLVEAITSIHATGTFYTPETGKLLVESMRDSYINTRISPRELEIIKHIADQHTTLEIADKLCISVHTVESHRKNILLKLDLKNSVGLVKYAIQKGLI